MDSKLRTLAVAVIVAALVRSAPAMEVLPFIADDYQKAVGEARAKNVPLFVEVWAPW